MNTQTLDFPFELKSVSTGGTFTGYGSVFGVKDSYSDVIAQGAFAETLAKQQAAGRLPAMLWQHISAEPIGIYTSMTEDTVGLKVEGQIALETQRGAESYALLKLGAISGLSIGYKTQDESFDKATGINTLKKLELWEVSLVTFPANDAARVQGVKTIETITSLRDAERHLRESGMSRAEAVAFISKIKHFGQSDSDEGLQSIVDALNRLNKII